MLHESLSCFEGTLFCLVFHPLVKDRWVPIDGLPKAFVQTAAYGPRGHFDLFAEFRFGFRPEGLVEGGAGAARRGDGFTDCSGPGLGGGGWGGVGWGGGWGGWGGGEVGPGGGWVLRVDVLGGWLGLLGSGPFPCFAFQGDLRFGGCGVL